MLPVSSSKPILFNNIQIPKEIFLQHIVPYFTEKELLIASYVCNSWHEVLQENLQNIDAGNLFIQGFQGKDNFKTFIHLKDDNNFAISGFVSTNTNVCILKRRFGFLISVNSSGDVKELENSYHVLCSKGNIVFATCNLEKNLTAIDKETGSSLFNLDAKALRILAQYACESPIVLNIHVLSEDPLTFLIVFVEGVIAKCEFKNQKVCIIEHLNAPPSENYIASLSFSAVQDNLLFLSGFQRRGGEFFEVLCHQTRQSLNLGYNQKELLTTYTNHSTPRDESKAVVNGQLIKITPYYITSLSLTKEKINWTANTYFGWNFLIPPTSKWTILYNYDNRSYKGLIVWILETETGKTHKEYIFEASKKILTAKIVGTVLFLVFRDEIEMRDLIGTSLLDSWNPSEADESIIDMFFSGSRIFLLLKAKKGNVYIDVKNIDGTEIKKPDKKIEEKKENSLTQPSKIEHEEEITLSKVSASLEKSNQVLSTHVKPQEQTFSPKETPENTIKSTPCANSKVTAVALGIFTVLLLTGTALAYYRGAINLSIGLGISSIVSAGSTGILGTNHYLSQRKLKSLGNPIEQK